MSIQHSNDVHRLHRVCSRVSVKFLRHEKSFFYENSTHWSFSSASLRHLVLSNIRCKSTRYSALCLVRATRLVYSEGKLLLFQTHYPRHLKLDLDRLGFLQWDNYIQSSPHLHEIPFLKISRSCIDDLCILPLLELQSVLNIILKRASLGKAFGIVAMLEFDLRRGGSITCRNLYTTSI